MGGGRLREVVAHGGSTVLVSPKTYVKLKRRLSDSFFKSLYIPKAKGKVIRSYIAFQICYEKRRKSAVVPN